jgi:hypothetical protein
MVATSAYIAAMPAMRFYYYATPLPDGGWQLQSSRNLLPVRYAGKADALAAAGANCRREWEAEGTPYGIRMRDSRGEWMDVLLRGGTEPSPGASPA